jgi:hypothetical protein
MISSWSATVLPSIQHRKPFEQPYRRRGVPLATTRREHRPKAPPSVTMTLSGVAALLRAK